MNRSVVFGIAVLVAILGIALIDNGSQVNAGLFSRGGCAGRVDCDGGGGDCGGRIRHRHAHRCHGGLLARLRARRCAGRDCGGYDCGGAPAPDCCPAPAPACCPAPAPACCHVVPTCCAPAPTPVYEGAPIMTTPSEVTPTPETPATPEVAPEVPTAPPGNSAAVESGSHRIAFRGMQFRG